MATNPPHNGQFGTFRNFRISGRPVALRTALPDWSRPTRNQGSNYQSSALVDALEGEQPTPGGEGREDGRLHEEISSVTVLPMDELILANGAEPERWDVCNKELYSVLSLSTRGEASSFLVRFAERPDSRQQPDGQAAWKALTDTYLNSSMQRRRILLRTLNGLVMMPNQDPDEYLMEVFQQRDELEHIGESFAEARILDLILESFSDEPSPSDSPPSETPRSRRKKSRPRRVRCTPIASRAVTAKYFRAGRDASQL